MSFKNKSVRLDYRLILAMVPEPVEKMFVLMAYAIHEEMANIGIECDNKDAIIVGYSRKHLEGWLKYPIGIVEYARTSDEVVQPYTVYYRVDSRGVEIGLKYFRDKDHANYSPELAEKLLAHVKCPYVNMMLSTDFATFAAKKFVAALRENRADGSEI